MECNLFKMIMNSKNNPYPSLPRTGKVNKLTTKMNNQITEYISISFLSFNPTHKNICAYPKLKSYPSSCFLY